ncbi:MAG: hypothetical protein Kilf2KO_22480 [Rhodospirillales bacterium]
MSATRKYPACEGRLCSAGRMQRTLLMTDDKEAFEVHRLEVVNRGAVRLEFGRNAKMLWLLVW